MRVLNEPSCYHLRALDPVFRFEEITAGGGLRALRVWPRLSELL